MIKVKTDAEGIAVLTLDCPDSDQNLMSSALLAELEELLRRLDAQEEVRVLLIASGKPEGFLAGADLEEFLRFQTADQAEAFGRRAQATLAQLESGRFPVVAAIHGPCLGGGAELALACHYRVATTHPRTLFGWPAVGLGLIPAAGGTQRLPRLIGLGPALDLMLSGTTVNAPKARELGLIDEAVASEILLDVALRAARNLAAGKIERERSTKWRTAPRLMDATPVGRELLFQQARRGLSQGSQEPSAAALRILEAIRSGYHRDRQRGFAEEIRALGELAMTDACRNKIRLFFLERQVRNRPTWILDRAEARPVHKIAVIGGGQNGSRLAAQSAAAGWAVRLKEKDEKAAGNSLHTIQDHLESQVREGRLSRPESRQSFDRVSVCLDYSGFKGADLILEAVAEEPHEKREVARAIEGILRPECLYATASSCIPVSTLAADSALPDRMVGLHFSTPVHLTTLLEIVISPATAPWAAATALAAGRRLGRTCLLVRDGPGYYTTRILTPVLNEAARLLEEGATIEAIDQALVRWGFCLGPLALIDELGIDVAGQITKILGEAFPARMAPPSAISWVGADGRRGRKNGRGFYIYAGTRKHPDRTVYRLIPNGPPRREFVEEEILHRLLFPMLNEAVLCLEQEIMTSPGDGDIGAVLGLGFPASRGGPFRWLDTLGAPEAVRVLEGLAARHGERFQPAADLVERARSGRLFYPD